MRDVLIMLTSIAVQGRKGMHTHENKINHGHEFLAQDTCIPGGVCPIEACTSSA